MEKLETYENAERAYNDAIEAIQKRFGTSYDEYILNHLRAVRSAIGNKEYSTAILYASDLKKYAEATANPNNTLEEVRSAVSESGGLIKRQGKLKDNSGILKKSGNLYGTGLWMSKNIASDISDNHVIHHKKFPALSGIANDVSNYFRFGEGAGTAAAHMKIVSSTDVPFSEKILSHTNPLRMLGLADKITMPFFSDVHFEIKIFSGLVIEDALNHIIDDLDSKYLSLKKYWMDDKNYIILQFSYRADDAKRYGAQIIADLNNEKASQRTGAQTAPQSAENPYLVRYCPKCHTRCEVLDKWGYKYRCPKCNNTLKASETLSLGDLRQVEENKEQYAAIERAANAQRHVGEGIEQFVRGSFGEKSYIRYNNAAKDASYYEEVSKHVQALFKNRINFKVWKLYPLNMNILPMLGGHDLEVRMVFGKLDIELINEFAKTGTRGVDLNANLVNRINWLKRAQKYVSVEYLSELLNTLNADKFMVTEFKVDESIGSVTLKLNYVGYAVPLDRVEAPEHGKRPKWADWDVPITPRMKKPSIWDKMFGKGKKKKEGAKKEGVSLLKIIGGYWPNILILLLGWGLFAWELVRFGGGDFGPEYYGYAVIGTLIGLLTMALEIKEKFEKENGEKKIVEEKVLATEERAWSAHAEAETARKEEEDKDTDKKDEEYYAPKKKIKDAVLPGTPSAAAEMLRKQEEEEE